MEEQQWTATATDTLHYLRQKAATNPLLQAQLEAAFWEAVAKQSPTPVEDETVDDDGE